MGTCAFAGIVGLLTVWGAMPGEGTPAVVEPARRIPIACQADVIVVGGSTGAVSAAVAAAGKGAKVFLAAPRTYLGEDMCGTLRLWLEEGEVPTGPLARLIFADRPAPGGFGQGMRFTYQTDRPSGGKHKDTSPPSRLSDGEYGSAATQSVEYDDDVTITADLGEVRTIRKVALLAYERAGDFEVAEVTISAGADGKQWEQVAAVRNKELGTGATDNTVRTLSAPASLKARYVKLAVRKTADVKRILLGEVIIEGEQPATNLAPASAAAPRTGFIRPMQVKKTLDDALLSAGVQFLFATYATDVLRDEAGNPCGIVMANRAGRQAVVGKVIIDATDRASLARIAGAKAQPWPAGPQTFRRVVIGGEPVLGKDLTARKLPFTLNPSGQDVGKSGAGKVGAKAAVSPDRFDVIEYTLTLPMPDASFASFAAAEQLARDMTFHPEQVDESETLFQIPPDPIKARKSFTGAWTGVEGLDLDAFRPADVARFYVLGGCADIPREQAGKLLRPPALMDMGARIGSAAADEAKSLPQPKEAKLPGGPIRPVAAGEVREMLSGLRPLAEVATLAAEQRPLPVIGQYDVVVVGGGTSGAPAGIGAARGGAKTLVVEYLHGLGGVSTIGLIGKYYHGYREGFTAEIDKGVAAIDTQRGVNAKMQWYRSELRKAKVDIWFGAMGCGALVEKDRIVGVVVATPQGRGVVLAKAVIDGTGNADIAAAGGAPCVYHDGTELAVQGTGLPPRALGASYTNTDYTFADEADMLGVWGLFVYARQKYKNSYDLGQLIDTRERRRIVGEFVINPMDEINGRTYPDSVVYCMSNFDSHGYTIHPVFFLEMPPHKDIYTYVPYRALLPKGMEGILVVGLAVSAHRDAVPVIRMQPDLQNEGYAAGIAASMAARVGTGLRQVDIKKLQKHLVDIKSLPANVLTDKDSYPIPTEKLAEAVKSLKDNYKGVSVVLTGAEQSLPMLRKAHAESPGAKERLIYAHVLGMMSDGTGVAELMGAVESASWDKGWNFKGMGQFGWSVSQLDSFIIALGKTRDRRSLPVLIERARQLDATQEFSHIRAVALAMEYIGDPSAAGVLAELLRKPRMGGHWVTAPSQATTQPDAATRPGVPAERVSTRFEDRNSALREILLARALYRCGDKDGLGKRILSEYANDLRAQFAAHARAVLAGGSK